MDSPIEVLSRLKLLRNVLEKLKSEVKGWRLNPILFLQGSMFRTNKWAPCA